MKPIFLFSLFLCSIATQAQDLTNLSNETNTLEKQFTEVIDGSNNYQDYKVIKKVKINRLRQNILDSVAAFETKIEALNTQIDTQNSEIETLNTNLSGTKENLSLSQEREDGIEIFGVVTEKSIYNTIMWSIVGVLALLLGFFIFRFKNSHAVTRSAQLKLAETEIELDAVKLSKIEEQQQLRRKLQDEINKNRKLNG